MVTMREEWVRRAWGVQIALGLFAATAWAQAPTATGRIQFGVRTLWDKWARASSKFAEYESIPEGLYLSHVTLGLNWGQTGYHLALQAGDALEGDQQVRIRAGRDGRWELGLQFDKLPHAFSRTGRSIYTQTGPGVYRLADDVQALFRTISTTDIDPATPGTQRDLPQLESLINGLARPVNLSLQRERIAATFRYNPTPKWDLTLRYSQENQRGARPFGATFSFNPTEQPEPIDYRTRQVQAGVQWSDRSLTLQAGYTGSFFHNRIDALVWDNPFQESDAAGAPAAGRIDLYPSSSAHQGTLSAAVANLPLQSRWTVTATYGLMLQDDSLLPFTVNSAIANVPALPATSVNGKVRTLLLGSTLTSRPVPRVTLTLRYRSYDRDNRTPSLTFSDYVRTDQVLGGVARRNAPYGYTRKTAGVDASWRPVPAVSVRGGYAWEGWDREHRDVLSTKENTFGGSVDINHARWLFLRASYRHADRTAEDYDGERTAEFTFPNGEPGLGQLPELRKFDQASRRRDRAEFIARLSPRDQLDVTATYSLTDDDYHESAYGVLKSKEQGPALELAYSPTPRISVFAEFAWEENTLSMQSRQRNPPSGTNPANDKPDNDWVSNVRDRVKTYAVGLTGYLLQDRVRAELRYSASDGTGLTRTRTPGTPDLVTTAEDYPQTVSNLRLASAALSYPLGSQLDVQFDWRYYRYDEVDYALDIMTPFMGYYDASSVLTVWLGATRPGHRAHVASLGLSYRF